MTSIHVGTGVLARLTIRSPASEFRQRNRLAEVGETLDLVRGCVYYEKSYFGARHASPAVGRGWHWGMLGTVMGYVLVTCKCGDFASNREELN